MGTSENISNEIRKMGERSVLMLPESSRPTLHVLIRRVRQSFKKRRYYVFKTNDIKQLAIVRHKDVEANPMTVFPRKAKDDPDRSITVLGKGTLIYLCFYNFNIKEWRILGDRYGDPSLKEWIYIPSIFSE